MWFLEPVVLLSFVFLCLFLLLFDSFLDPEQWNIDVVLMLMWVACIFGVCD